MSKNLNETGTPVSDKVHLDEIAVIPGLDGRPGYPLRTLPGRLPLA
jgi:hypothetical protein